MVRRFLFVFSLGALACKSPPADDATDVAGPTDATGPTDTRATGADTGAPATLAVVGMSPTDGEVDVEPTASIVLSFSDEVEARSVTEDSVQVLVGGQPVDATRTVDGVQVRIEPTQPWLLRAEVSVRLGTQVAATSGATLAPAFGAAFQIRDGAWEAVASSFRAEVESFHPYTVPAGNHLGVVAFPITHLTAPMSYSELDAITYDPLTGDFAAETAIRDTQGFVGDFERVRAAVDADGNSVFVTRTADALHIDELTSSGWKEVHTAKPSALGTSYEIAMHAGNPLAAWNLAGGVVVSFFEPREDAWSPRTYVAKDGALWSILQLPSGDLQFLYERASGGLFSKVYDGTFGLERRVSAAGIDANWVRHTWSPDGARATWQQDDTEVYGASWDRARDVWTLPEQVTTASGGGEVCGTSSGLRIAAHRTSSQARASVARAGGDFGPPQVVSDTKGMEFAWCFLDDAGNGHGLWASYGTDEVLWARFEEGAWRAAEALPIQTADVRRWFVDPSGRIVLFYGVAGGARALRFR